VRELPRMLAPDHQTVGGAHHHRLDGGVVPRVHEVHRGHAVRLSPTDEVGNEQSFQDSGVDDQVRALLGQERVQGGIAADLRQHSALVDVVDDRPGVDPALREVPVAQRLPPEAEQCTLVAGTPHASQNGGHVEPPVQIGALVGNADRSETRQRQGGGIGTDALMRGKHVDDFMIPLEGREHTGLDEVPDHDVVVDEDGDPCQPRSSYRAFPTTNPPSASSHAPVSTPPRLSARRHD
jgi:hypothetical protein